MTYSQFTLSDIKHKFHLTLNEETDLFATVAEATIGDTLTTILAENVPLALAIHTEKARSELIIAPILVEFRRILHHTVSLFSGVEFNIAEEEGLKRVCDFIISHSKEQLLVTAPVITVVEAKNDNIKIGLAQCIAQMLAAQLFNRQAENDVEVVYGIVTTGSIWKFLRLEAETVFISWEIKSTSAPRTVSGLRPV
jgi:hypothetical protein